MIPDLSLKDYGTLLNLVQRVTGESDFEWQEPSYQEAVTKLENKLLECILAQGSK